MTRKVGLILIDLQQSFVSGYWMKSVGVSDVSRITDAMQEAGRLLASLPNHVPVLLSQCPFPTPQDFSLLPVVEENTRGRPNVTRVIKPGNDILADPATHKWIEGIINVSTAKKYYYIYII